MSEVTDAIKEQADHKADVCTISLDCESEDFRRTAIPYAVGYMSSTHGLTDLKYSEKTLTFRRLDL